MAVQLKTTPLIRSLLKELRPGRRHVCTASRVNKPVYKANIGVLTQSSVQDSATLRLNSNKTHCLTINNQQIGDFPLANISYDCPKIPSLNVEITPPPSLNRVNPLEDPRTNQIKRRSPGVDGPEKQASVRMRIRHKKMKKHQLKRLRERTWPIIRKTRHLKHLKKTRIYNNKLETLRAYGTQFNAIDFVQSSVNKAREKGYFIDILGPHSESFNFKDVPKEKKESKPDLASVLQGLSVREK